MGIKATSILFSNEFRAEKVDFLKALVGDKVTIEIEIDVEETIVSSVDNPIIYRNNDGYTGSTATEGWITDAANRFSNVKIGDVLRRWDYILNLFSATHTVLDKLDDGSLFIDNTSGGNNVVLSSAAFSIATPITSVKYKWNFIENEEASNFNSLVDGTIQQAEIQTKLASDLTQSLMTMLGSKCYQTGSILIEGLGIDSTTFYRSNYKITHETIVTPFMLTSQFEDLVSGINAGYFQNENCLKAIFDFEASYNYSDPNRIQTEEVTEVVGNTGGYNENFNTGIQRYLVDSVVIKDASLAVIPNVELTTNDQTIEIVIKNTVNSPFSNNNTKFTLNFCKAPADQVEYQVNGKTLDQNFLFDRALQTVGSAAVNGDEYGTSRQVFKNITAAFISTSEIKITATIDFSTAIVTELSALNTAQYMIFVSTQNHTLTTLLSDRETLLVDIGEFFVNNSDPTMIVFDTLKLMRHPESDVDTEGSDTISVFPGDEVTAYSRFYIDKNGRLTDTIVLTNLYARFKAKNTSTLDEFTLEDFSFQMDNLEVISGNQNVDFSVNKIYHIPSTEIRKKIKIKRREDLDNSNKYYYEVYFPIIIRWEYWEKLTGVNDAFYNTSEPNNGRNHKWQRYDTFANWNLYYELEIDATKNGSGLTYMSEKSIEMHDYDTNPDWAVTIKSYKHSNNSLLYDGVTMRNFLLGYDVVRIESEFVKTTNIPNINKIKVVIDIERFELGGISERRRLSSMYALGDDDTWLYSVDGSNKVKLTLTAPDTVLAECLIDQTKLDLTNKKYTVRARVYELVEPTLKAFQDGALFNFQDGNPYAFQS